MRLIRRPTSSAGGGVGLASATLMLLAMANMASGMVLLHTASVYGRLLVPPPTQLQASTDARPSQDRPPAFDTVRHQAEVQSPAQIARQVAKAADNAHRRVHVAMSDHERLVRTAAHAAVEIRQQLHALVHSFAQRLGDATVSSQAHASSVESPPTVHADADADADTTSIASAEAGAQAEAETPTETTAAATQEDHVEAAFRAHATLAAAGGWWMPGGALNNLGDLGGSGGVRTRTWKFEFKSPTRSRSAATRSGCGTAQPQDDSERHDVFQAVASLAAKAAAVAQDALASASVPEDAGGGTPNVKPAKSTLHKNTVATDYGHSVDAKPTKTRQTTQTTHAPRSAAATAAAVRHLQQAVQAELDWLEARADRNERFLRLLALAIAALALTEIGECLIDAYKARRRRSRHRRRRAELGSVESMPQEQRQIEDKEQHEEEAEIVDEKSLIGLHELGFVV